MNNTDLFTYRSKTVRANRNTGREASLVSSPFEVVLEDGNGVTKILKSELTFIGTMPAGTIGANPWADHQHHLYQGMLTFDGRHLISRWLTGVGIPVHHSDGPKDFIEAMVRDATDDTFDRWVDEHGLEDDSLKSYRTWQTCVEAELHLRQLLGNPWQSRLKDVVTEWDS
jgi:hypothetical protein